MSMRFVCREYVRLYVSAHRTTYLTGRRAAIAIRNIAKEQTIRECILVHIDLLIEGTQHIETGRVNNGH